MINDYLLNMQHNPVLTPRFYFSAAGVNCAIICQDQDFLNLLMKRYWCFETKNQPEYEFMVQIQPSILNYSGGSSRPALVVKRMGKGNNFVIKGPSYIALANTNTRKVLVKMADTSGFDDFLHVIFALILAGKGGLVLDALTVQQKEGVNIFVKTIDEPDLANALTIGNPVVIRPRNSRFYIYSTPFHDEQTEKPITDRVMLRALYLLKKDYRKGLDSLERAAAVSELVRCASWFTDDPFLRNRISYTCTTVIDSVPAYKLNF